MDGYLEHYGVKGMKWGVRNDKRPDELRVRKTDSGVTKRVKRDYNDLDNEAFIKKYAVSKKTYAKRVNRYGDPYMNAPLAKMGKKLKKRADKKRAKKRAGVETANLIIRAVGPKHLKDI